MSYLNSVHRKHGRNKAELIAHIQACAREGQPQLYKALREAVQEQKGGFTRLSAQTGLGRASLYKSLSETGNPGHDTICRVLEALGLTWAVVTGEQVTPDMISQTSSASLISVMDRGGDVEYGALTQEALSISEEDQQARFRSLTEALYAEADALERRPGEFSNPGKARIAEMIANKQRKKGLRV